MSEQKHTPPRKDISENAVAARRMCSAAGLRRQLSRDLRAIRGAYRKALGRDIRTGIAEWLCDNFYILEREGRTVLRELRHQKPLPSAERGEKFCAVYRVCEIVAQDGLLPPGDELRSAAKKASRGALSGRELDALPMMLRAALLHVASASVQEGEDETLRTTRLGNAIKSMRLLGGVDFAGMIEELSRVESILNGDPSGAYPRMSEESRAFYRRRVSAIAEKRRTDEEAVAREAVEAAARADEERKRHVGYYILEAEARQGRRRMRGRVTLTVQALLPAALSVILGLVTRTPWIIPVIFLPLWEALRPIVDFFSLKKVPPSFVPRMEQNGAVDEAGRSLVVVSTLISSPDKAGNLARRLERLYRTNGRGAVMFCALADLKEDRYPDRPEDGPALAATARAIRALNRKYGDHFALLVRPRVFSATQRAYAGWERKRGALLELCRLIKGETPHFIAKEGNIALLQKSRYIIALDADTELLMDTAAELVSCAMHPLNRPVLDVPRGKVTAGYGIIAPRIGTDLAAAGHTPFSRVMAGVGGITAYDTAAGDLYQDLFAEGIFAGKGIIDVDAFYTILNTAFAEGKILSHDILEGEFLRTAYLSDIEMVDGYPSALGPFISRLHRWVRGDWQNIGWISRRTRRADGIGNPLGALGRYKLFDNLRRSVTPIAALLSIALSLSANGWPGRILALAGILSCTGAGIFAALYGMFSGGFSMLSRKYYSKAMPQAMQAVSQAALMLIMLPRVALASLDAVCRALWRMTVSRRGLLDWVTAADSEKKDGGFFHLLTANAPSALIGAALTVFGGGVTRLVGILFLCLIPVDAITRRPGREGVRPLSHATQERLTSYAAAMWRFYEEHCGLENNYLPPDNAQEAPVAVVAHRTSPTNIGLYLLSCLAARDFGFIETEALCERVAHTLTTLEHLDKWNGNLYNWYDTHTLKPLIPRYVSTVDSGNFACCLVALREGLMEFAAELREVHDLCARIDAIVDETDLSPFYNRRRKLFHIGYDVESEAFSGSYYDLLMSEARMTSYFAIATRQVPKKHWGAMGRTLARMGGYTGPVSWTGTMFEYFMPHLLLPVHNGSLGYEALRFCTWCQRQRVRGKGAPWGMSESGFYAFDTHLNYQYKAHGVQKLGLKRGLGAELVVSPYSTFLTLPFEPSAALQNLRWLEKIGLFGRCGFYEAADFTPRRTGNRSFAVVRSYMAHHVGMSLIATANLLHDFSFCARFMRNGMMDAASELLQEKIPSGAVVFEDVFRRDVPEKPGRSISGVEEYDEINPASPRMHMLYNGEWTLAVTDTGAGVSLYRGMDVTRRSADLLRRPMGLFAMVRVGKDVIPLTRAPDYRSDAAHRVEFASSYAAFYAAKGHVEAGMMASLHPRLACEQRQIRVRNKSAARIKAEVLIYFEPSLAGTADDAAHPAFSRIFVESQYDVGAAVLHFSRRQRKGESRLHLAAGFAEAVPFEYDCARERILSRPDGIVSLARAATIPLTPGQGVPDTACCIRATVEVPAKSARSLSFLLCAAETREEAISRLVSVREDGALTPARSAASPFEGGGMEARLADMVLPQIFYPLKDARAILEAARENRLGAPALWGMGISGDLPILLLEMMGGGDTMRLEAYMRLLRLLKMAGVPVDLAILYREGGDYARPTLAAVQDIATREGVDHLIGARGGVHMVDMVRYGSDVITLLKAAACHIAPESLVRIGMGPLEFTPAVIHAAGARGKKESGLTVQNGVFSSKGFTVTDKPALPWSHVLANPTFGTLVSDQALGFTWAVNSRENKLTPWYNDTRTDNRGEMLLLRVGERIYDCIMGARATFAPDKAIYHSRVGALDVTVTVTVPPRGTLKRVTLDVRNSGGEEAALQAAYYTEPVLGVDRGSARHIAARWENGALILRNPWNSAVPGAMLLTADGGADSCACDRAAFLSGRWNDHTLSPLPDPCAAVIVNRVIPPHKSAAVGFTLAWAASMGALPRIPVIPGRGTPAYSIQIHTPDEALNHMINTWLPHQIAASRFMGRTAFYQCGGAWGFRDQLQDSLALLYTDPLMTRRHIIRAAAHQFLEGDVLHWWHTLPEAGGGLRGVRTRYSDDLLWLPYVLCLYVAHTGDGSILSIPVHYLTAPTLEDDEHERYFAPERSSLREDVYSHAIRAIERAMRFGDHGLPLIGGGDWNDGFNLVGIRGRGESVWLGMFLIMVLEEIAPLCEMRGDGERAARYREEAARLRAALDATAWDGDWYLRAFYDDGTGMGGHKSSECQIDSLPQSFAVLCGMPDWGRRRSALDACMKYLVNKERGYVRLFNPPFDTSPKKPGYVKAYPPGLRENGGQYTHAACWLMMALLREGRTEDGYDLVRLLNPASACRDPERAAAYKTEPYAMAADIYAHPDAAGRGGWSLYTGAAGWYYRAVIEELLGIKIRGGEVTVAPHLPAEWEGFTAEITLDGKRIRINQDGVIDADSKHAARGDLS